MASVYTNDLRLEEIGTGEQSGTWGTTTNTNLELIAEAFSFGTEAITTNADTHTTTIADGSTDPGRSIFLKYTGSLDSACTITLGPNTVSKLWFIENATSGSQNIIISQGSGANVTIAAGQTKAVYSDGAGSGAAIVDALQDLAIPDLFIDDDLTLQSDGAVLSFGADSDTTFTHTDGSGLTLNSTNKIMFNDASQFIQGSSGTVLSLGATDEIDLTATAIDINGTLDVSGSAVFNTSVEVVTSDNSTQLTLKSTDADASVGPVMVFERESASAASDDEIGRILFVGRNAENNADVNYGSIETHISAASAASAGGYMKFRVASHDGETQSGLEIRDGNAEDEVDVTIGNGTASITTVAGNLNVVTDLDVDGTTNLDVVDIDGATNIDLADGVADNAYALIVKNQEATDDRSYGLLVHAGSTSTDRALVINDHDGSNALFYVTGAGDVGIQTTAPKRHLHINGGNESVKLQITNTTTGSSSDGDGFQVGIATDGTANLEQREDADMVFSTDNSPRMTIDASGNVGIGTGTSSVTKNLEIRTDAGDEGILVKSTGDTSNEIAGDANRTSADAALLGVTGKWNGTSVGQILFQAGADTTNKDDGFITFRTSSADNIAERMRIKSNGTIMSVDAGTNNTRFGEDAGAALVSGNNSNVLIGDAAGTSLTSPASFNIAVGHLALDADTKGDQSVAIGYTALSNQNFTSTADANNIAIGYQAGVDLSTGQNNVFIGVGAAASSSSNRLSGDRNVAIGTNALNVLQGAASENIAIGCFAGDAITTALHNVVIGDSAGSNLTTQGGNIAIGHNALSTGQSVDNVVIGNNAGLQLTADENVIIGVNAGDGATSITQCTIVGSNAASGATMTGDNNTLIGRLTGNALTSGSENTFVGAEAGDGTDDAGSNTAVGFRALSANCGAGNTCVGTEAGKVITGQNNIIIGNQAAVQSTSCDDSVIIGKGAVDSVDMTGHDSIVIGSGAATNMTGARNVVIGKGAASTTTNLTTGTDNVFIGFQNKTNSSATTNAICMGDSVTSQGDNTFTFGKDSTSSSITFGGGSIDVPSDERYKENIQTSTAGLSFINDLRPVTFQWKKEKDIPTDHEAYVEGSDTRVMLSNGETNHGFIAQEVKAVIDAHSEIKDGFKMWSAEQREDAEGNPVENTRQRLAPSELIPILTKAIQELSAKNDALEARIATLEEL